MSVCLSTCRASQTLIIIVAMRLRLSLICIHLTHPWNFTERRIILCRYKYKENYCLQVQKEFSVTISSSPCRASVYATVRGSSPWQPGVTTECPQYWPVCWLQGQVQQDPSHGGSRSWQDWCHQVPTRERVSCVLQGLVYGSLSWCSDTSEWRRTLCTLILDTLFLPKGFVHHTWIWK